ncbi:MAG: hypothetical protein OHK006_09220 [Thermodesulfovibrionales bacterium]
MPAMTYLDALKTGVRLVNHRWQLVLVQVGMLVANFLFFLLMVGVPLGIAFIIFGLDLFQLASLKEILEQLGRPSQLLSDYLGFALMIIAGFFLYLTLVTVAGIYVFGGSIGLIGSAVIDPSVRFTTRGFFAEAKRNFGPLLWFSLFLGLMFLLLTFVLGLLVSGIAALVSMARGQDSTLALFLSIFFSLVTGLLAAGGTVVAFAVTVYGVAELFFRREGSWKAFRGAIAFIIRNQAAFWLYVVLFVGYVLLSFALILVTYPFNLIPFIGSFLSFPFQVLSFVVQSYLGLVLVATIFTYYYETEIRMPRLPFGRGDGGSSPPADTATPGGTGQAPPLQDQAAPPSA